MMSTALIVLLISCATMTSMGLLLLYAGSTKLDGIAGLGKWGTAFLLFALAHLSFIASAESMLFQGMVLGHSLIIIGFMFGNQGLRLFFNEPARHTKTRLFLYVFCFVVAFTFFTFVYESLNARIILFSMFGLVINFDMLVLLWRHQRQSSSTYLLMGALLVLASSRVLRIMAAAFDGPIDNPATIQDATASHLVFLSLPIVVAPIITAAFLMMASEKLNQQLVHLNRLDPLTKALNKTALHQELEREVKRSHRYSSPLSVLMIDLDNFKSINDNQGHLAGDEILKAVVATIRSSLRVSDTVARFGGDEFTVLLPETDSESAKFIANRTTTLLENLLPTGCSASVGIALLRPEDTPISLLQRADQALYQNKPNHKGGTQASPVEMTSSIKQST
jgi:diguanylate cyclase (GGDEF)-like protein